MNGSPGATDIGRHSLSIGPIVINRGRAGTVGARSRREEVSPNLYSIRDAQGHVQKICCIRAKYHIPGNVPYMRYFLARVYQFQFYRAMCQAAGYKGPLNRCSVYGSKEAGAKLNAMLELGRSKPWPEALKAMTGTDKADASAIIEYFQPLLDWLKEQNKGEKEGWTLPADPLK